MNQLEENRAVIGEVDKEMAKQFVRRFEAVRKIADYKMEQGLPVLDRSREEALIAEKEQLVPEELRPYFRMWYAGMMGASRAYQSDLIARHNDGSAAQE